MEEDEFEVQRRLMLAKRKEQQKKEYAWLREQTKMREIEVREAEDKHIDNQQGKSHSFRFHIIWYHVFCVLQTFFDYPVVMAHAKFRRLHKELWDYVNKQIDGPEALNDELEQTDRYGVVEYQ
ncbi:MAG: hypothetical protein E7350_00750 [Clostridiales bacterium]|nr:hypothetical protein [Clostridiales bacterium]